MEEPINSKIEIVIDHDHLDSVLDIITEEKLLGYTSVKKEKEKEFKTEIPKNFKSENSQYISIKCSEKERSKVLSKLFPLITQIGGFCIAYSQFLEL